MDALYAAFEDIKGRIMDILWTGGISQRKYSKVTLFCKKHWFLENFFINQQNG